VSTNAINNQKSKRKENSLLQLGHTKDIAKTISAAHLEVNNLSPGFFNFSLCRAAELMRMNRQRFS